jgi:hypothetical protein
MRLCSQNWKYSHKKAQKAQEIICASCASLWRNGFEAMVEKWILVLLYRILWKWMLVPLFHAFQASWHILKWKA